MIKDNTPSDRRIMKFDRALLDEATERHLTHYVAILRLDPELYETGDTFAEWADRCGAEVKRTDEGGAVVRRGGDEAAGYIFITSEQYAEIETELLHAAQSAGSDK